MNPLNVPPWGANDVIMETQRLAMQLREGGLCWGQEETWGHILAPHLFLPIRAMMKTAETEDVPPLAEDNIYVYLNAVCLKASVSIYYLCL